MKKHKIWKQLQYEIFLIPAVLSFTIFTMVPLFRTIYFSFTNFDGLSKDYDFVGLANYGNLFKDSLMMRALGNTLLYAVCMVLLVNLLALPLAVLLDNPARSKPFERAVFFFPSVLSSLLIGYIWGYIFSPTASGAINSILGALGIDKMPWLSDPVMSKVVILIVAVWANIGWYAVVNIAYLQTIPASYYEAARIDGASRLQVFWRITVPMMAPAFTVNTLLLLTNGLKVYEMPYAMTGGGPGTFNFTLTQIIMQRGFSDRQYGLSSAMATVFILIVMVVAVFQYKSMSRKEEDLG